MANASLVEILAPQVVLEVISRLKPGRGPLASWLGFQPNRYNEDTVSISGPNTRNQGPGDGGNPGTVRSVSYRIFDHTRVPMKARAPGAGPATVAQNPMGTNQVEIARFHQKIPLNYEFLGQLALIAGPNSQVDQGGRSYIARQTTFLAEQANNMVEMLAAGMMRDSLYFIQSGDDWLPTFTAPVAPTTGFQVNFKIPAGNKNQLNMLGGGNLIGVSWANLAAPILTNLNQIIAAYSQLSRYPMTDIWINSTMWMNILLNTEVRNTAGSSNTPFAEFELMDDGGMDGSGPANQFSAILKGMPMVTWHMCNDALALNTDTDPVYSTAPASATLAKLVPDNMAIFCTEPRPTWTQMIHGGEYVVENPGASPVLRMGYYFWHETVTQPACVELLSLLNCVPVLYVPTVIAPATVVF
jgi:hypothetical protein